MSRTALILAAHGSRHEPAANDAIRRMADALTLRLHFDDIIAAFHQGAPTFATVLDRIDADDVTVVPVMTSEGYYCNEFLPGELQKNKRYREVRLVQTPPVGVHPEMAELVRHRGDELLAMYGFDATRTTLALVGHGTPRNPQSRIATEALARTLRRISSFAEIIIVFLDEEPTVEQIASHANYPDIVVIPFLIGSGQHATDDVPRRLGMKLLDDVVLPFVKRIGNRRVVCDRPIGADPGLIDILARAATSCSPHPCGIAAKRAGLPFQVRGSTRPFPSRTGGRCLRLGTRGSAMALWQAEHVASQLRVLGAKIEIVEVSTLGDRITDRAIADLPSDAPFTGDIEEALRDGRIDLAVHCLKDLPLRPSPGLCIAATLKRDDIAEAIVSHHRLRLGNLPTGAIVGTSSPRRAAQLLAIRPDLRIETIRGPVDDRVRQVQSGRFDAAILAVAGLRRLGLLDEIAEVLPLHDFLPAPGQGALVLQVRDNDEAARQLCSTLDDRPTRLAITAELEFLRPYENSRDPVAAAYAIVSRQIQLHARLLSADGQSVRDVTVAGSDPIAVACQAIKRLEADEPIQSRMSQPSAVGVAT